MHSWCWQNEAALVSQNKKAVLDYTVFVLWILGLTQWSGSCVVKQSTEPDDEALCAIEPHVEQLVSIIQSWIVLKSDDVGGLA
eukprot:647823-Pelagomonas_calceolata.AAC.5